MRIGVTSLSSARMREVGGQGPKATNLGSLEITENPKSH